MVVTRSYASKYNVKLYNEIDNYKKKNNNNDNDNNYVFLFIYILFCFLMTFLVYSILTNYYTSNKFNELNKDNNFILLENNLPEKTLEYLSDNLYSRLPAKSYENNYNNFEELFYRFISEDRYDYYLHFFN
jgi:hypothetical protein